MKTIIACGIVALLCSAATATATSFITSADIKNGTIRSVDLQNGNVRSIDIKNGTIQERDLSAALRKKVNTLGVGLKGDKGDTGATGAQGITGAPAFTKVLSLGGAFEATNPSVSMSDAGVEFGPYADSSTGGSLKFDGVKGMKLSDIKQLSFTTRHNSSDNSPISAPYLRIFLDGDSHDVIFDATQCATVVPAENVFRSYEVVGADVRYDDDGCDGVAPDQQSWDDVVAAHGNQVITAIYVTTGFSGGTNLSALLRNLSVNGNEFRFGS